MPNRTLLTKPYKEPSSARPRALVIYHHPCPDGTFAAYAAYLGLLKQGFEVTFMEGVYQSAGLPPVESYDQVVLVDFSYKRGDLIRICDRAKSVLIIDHHPTAIAEVGDLVHPKLTKVLDTKESGAVMTWRHYYPDIEVPELYLYIQDRDLWAWELPFSHEISAWVSAQSLDSPLDVEAALKAYHFEVSAQVGEGILSAQRKRVNLMLRNTQDLTVVTPSGPLAFKVCNAPQDMSDLGHELALKSSQGLGLVWFQTQDPSQVKLSFRGLGRYDLAQVASLLGGGGHFNAAGSIIDSQVWLSALRSGTLTLPLPPI